VPRFVGQAMLKLTCVTDWGYLAGWRDTSPPNMTPIFNQIGTIARARISTKRHVRFGIGLHRVIAGAQAYNM